MANLGPPAGATAHFLPGPGPAGTRAVRVGGVSKGELLSRLRAADIAMNEAALTLFADARFLTSPESATRDIVELSVASLGFAGGATFAELVERAARHGLRPCPLELGPHLRLQYRSQPEAAAGRPGTPHGAPPGSVTVVSEPLSEDGDTPRGFYLRRFEGKLWLRGYRSGRGHHWNPHDVVAFLGGATRP